jgi:hypothetical protein
MINSFMPSPQILGKGVHVLVLPFEQPMPINLLFPREICGSSIEVMNKDGVFEGKETILYLYEQLIVSERYQVLRPFQVIRLTLKRTIKLVWDVQVEFQSRSSVKQSAMLCDNKYSHETALYLIQLCELVYEDESYIEQVLNDHYDFDRFYYFSRQTTHELSIQNQRLRLLYLFLKSQEVVVDLQFMKLIQFNDESGKHVILFVFKGSKEAEDWLTNFSVKGTEFMGKDSTKVHQGFQDALRLFLDTVKQNYFELGGERFNLDDTVLPQLNEKTKIILTGHSLGGAIATLAGCYFYEKGIDPNNLEVYSFGAPPVADQYFVDHYQDKFPVYRIVNGLDPVPKLAALSRKLFHIGDEIMLPSNDGEGHLGIGYIDNLLDMLEKKPVFSFVEGRTFL